MNQTKSFIGGLGHYMRKAACHLGGMDSSHPYCWRGKRLHHHGGDICCVFVFCVMRSLLVVSLIVCKNVPEHDLKVCILPYYKVNRHYMLTHPHVHHTRNLAPLGLICLEGFCLRAAPQICQAGTSRKSLTERRGTQTQRKFFRRWDCRAFALTLHELAAHREFHSQSTNLSAVSG
jgi:hypothetical protein